MTRDEHLQWCKDRAMECVKMGDLSQAFASFCSDVKKHEETAQIASNPLIGIGMMCAALGDAAGMRSWILGWN